MKKNRYDLRPVACANCGKTAWVPKDNSALRLCEWCERKIKWRGDRVRRMGGGRSESTGRKR